MYQLGSSATVTCFSNLSVASIIWRWSNDILREDNSGQQKLVLDITINRSDNNTVYTCEITIVLPTGNTAVTIETFAVNIGGKYFTDAAIMLVIYFSQLETMLRPPTSIMASPITSSEVTIRWMFVEPFNPSLQETCRVFYGSNLRPLAVVSSEVTAVDGLQDYSITLTLLTAATHYVYVIECRNKLLGGEMNCTQMEFRTADSGKLANVCGNDHSLIFACF